MPRLGMLFLISISIFAQQTEVTRQQTCYVSDEGTSSSLLESYIVGLQMDLYILSAFQPKSPENVINLQKVASEVVFSLANAFNAFGEQSRKCSLPDEEYYQKTLQANTMSIHLSEICGIDECISALELNNGR